MPHLPLAALAASAALLAAAPQIAAQTAPQPQAETATPDPAPAWSAGQGNDGRQQFARITQPPHRLTYLCQRGGPDMLVIEGMSGRVENLRLRIDDQPQALRFMQHGPRRTAPAQLGSPLIRAMFSGKILTVQDDAGSASFALDGAEPAMRQAMGRCLRRR
jgi:hypothetical protein